MNRDDRDIDPDLERAIRSFAKEECHKMWNNKKCSAISRDSRGQKPYKFGNQNGRKK